MVRRRVCGVRMPYYGNIEYLLIQSKSEGPDGCLKCLLDLHQRTTSGPSTHRSIDVFLGGISDTRGGGKNCTTKIFLYKLLIKFYTTKVTPQNLHHKSLLPTKFPLQKLHHKSYTTKSPPPFPPRKTSMSLTISQTSIGVIQKLIIER